MLPLPTASVAGCPSRPHFGQHQVNPLNSEVTEHARSHCQVSGTEPQMRHVSDLTQQGDAAVVVAA